MRGSRLYSRMPRALAKQVCGCCGLAKGGEILPATAAAAAAAIYRKRGGVGNFARGTGRARADADMQRRFDATSAAAGRRCRCGLERSEIPICFLFIISFFEDAPATLGVKRVFLKYSENSNKLSDFHGAEINFLLYV